VLYEYQCPSCGWKGERVTRIADRDNQTCDEPVLRGPESVTHHECGEKLVREEFSLTARMPDQWKRGQK